MNMAARFLDLGFVLFQVQIQMRQGVILDPLGGVAQLVEFRQAVDGFGAAQRKAFAQAGQGLGQLAVGHGLAGVLLEPAGLGFHQAVSSSASPMAGWSVIPARTSATWRA